MKQVIIVFLCLVGVTPAFSQWKLEEGFESGNAVPLGWGVWNNTASTIDSTWNWTVRDTGQALPGALLVTSRAHSGVRAAGVTWWASLPSLQSDAWLVTRRVDDIEEGDALRFWATGGRSAPNYGDSLQVWISNIDSTPAGLLSGFKLGTIHWPPGSTYGLFAEHLYDLSFATGLDIWIGFRYYMDCTVSGFFVHVDDVTVGPANSVEPVDAGIPATFDLMQNYPNPFNPSTTMQFSVPRESFVTLKVFNALGQEVASLVSEKLSPGVYNATWDAGSVASGVYFYRLVAGEVVQSRKMVLSR